MKVIENYTRDFDVFYGDHIAPLRERAVAFHGQLFPGNYPPDADKVAFEATKAAGKPLPVSLISEGFRKQVEQARDFRSPFRRLRILPDVTPHGYTTKDVGAMENMVRRNVRAGEVAHVASFGAVAWRAGSVRGHYMDEYLWGVEQGIPRYSFWSVSEARPEGEPELRAVRLTSYDAAGSIAARLCLAPLDEELGAYVNFWHDIYDNARSRPVEP